MKKLSGFFCSTAKMRTFSRFNNASFINFYAAMLQKDESVACPSEMEGRDTYVNVTGQVKIIFNNQV